MVDTIQLAWRGAWDSSLLLCSWVMLMTTLRKGFKGSRTELFLLWVWKGRGPMEVLKALASLWLGRILNWHIGFYLKNIFAVFFFFLSVGFRVLGEGGLSFYHDYSTMSLQSHRMCLVFSKVNEIKDKNLQDNCQYSPFDIVFTVKLLMNGRFSG